MVLAAVIKLVVRLRPLDAQPDQFHIRADQSAGAAFDRGSRQDLFDALAPVLRVKPVIEEFCRFGAAWRSARGTSGMGWSI
jgi:hypothetical protein